MNDQILIQVVLQSIAVFKPKKTNHLIIVKHLFYKYLPTDHRNNCSNNELGCFYYPLRGIPPQLSIAPEVRFNILSLKLLNLASASLLTASGRFPVFTSG